MAGDMGISSAESGRRKKAPKVLEEISLRRAMNGKVVATHRFSHYDHEPEAHHLAATKEAVGGHIAKHMSLDESGPKAEPFVDDKEQL